MNMINVVTMVKMKLLLISTLLHLCSSQNFYYQQNGTLFDIYYGPQPIPGYQEMRSPKSFKESFHKRGERPGQCQNLEFVCTEPYPYSATFNFECEHDYQCPKCFKCCIPKCFQHKVCQPIVMEATSSGDIEILTTNPYVSTTATKEPEEITTLSITSTPGIVTTTTQSPTDQPSTVTIYTVTTREPTEETSTTLSTEEVVPTTKITTTQKASVTYSDQTNTEPQTTETFSTTFPYTATTETPKPSSEVTDVITTDQEITTAEITTSPVMNNTNITQQPITTQEISSTSDIEITTRNTSGTFETTSFRAETTSTTEILPTLAGPLNHEIITAETSSITTQKESTILTFSTITTENPEPNYTIISQVSIETTTIEQLPPMAIIDTSTFKESSEATTIVHSTTDETQTITTTRPEPEKQKTTTSISQNEIIAATKEISTNATSTTTKTEQITVEPTEKILEEKETSGNATTYSTLSIPEEQKTTTATKQNETVKVETVVPNTTLSNATETTPVTFTTEPPNTTEYFKMTEPEDLKIRTPNGTINMTQATVLLLPTVTSKPNTTLNEATLKYTQSTEPSSARVTNKSDLPEVTPTVLTSVTFSNATNKQNLNITDDEDLISGSGSGDGNEEHGKEFLGSDDEDFIGGSGSGDIPETSKGGNPDDRSGSKNGTLLPPSVYKGTTSKPIGDQDDFDIDDSVESSGMLSTTANSIIEKKVDKNQGDLINEKDKLQTDRDIPQNTNNTKPQNLGKESDKTQISTGQQSTIMDASFTKYEGFSKSVHEATKTLPFKATAEHFEYQELQQVMSTTIPYNVGTTLDRSILFPDEKVKSSEETGNIILIEDTNNVESDKNATRRNEEKVSFSEGNKNSSEKNKETAGTNNQMGKEFPDDENDDEDNINGSGSGDFVD